jgi:hypothetical protein
MGAPKMRVVGVFGVFLLGAVSVFAAEQGAAAGSGKTLQVQIQSKLDVGDVPGHELVQAIGDDELKTPDKIAGVALEGSKVRVFQQSDLVNGSGMVRGYAIWEATNGQKLFVIFGYSVPPSTSQKEFTSFEGTFEWIGGTGSLQKVRGKGTIEGEVSRRGEARYRWAGSYEIAEK